MLHVVWFVGLVIAAVVACAVGGFLGFRRGAVLEGVRLGCIFVPLPIAFLLARPLDGLFTFLFSRRLQGEIAEQLLANPEVASVAKTTLSALSAPIAFLVCWILLGALFFAGYLLFRRRYQKSVRYSFYDNGQQKRGGTEFRFSRPLGCLLGALCGFFFLVFATVPLTGYASLSVAAREGTEFEPSASDVALDTCFPARAERSLGGEFVFDALTVYAIDGQRVTAERELNVLLRSYPILIDFLQSDFTHVEDIDADELDRMAEYMDESPTLRIVSAAVLKEGSAAWIRGDTYLGVDLSTYEPEVKESIDLLLEPLTDTTKESVSQDVRNTASSVRALSKMLRFMQSVKDPAVSPKESLALLVEAERCVNEQTLPVLQSALATVLVNSKAVQATALCADFVSDVFLRCAAGGDSSAREAEIFNVFLSGVFVPEKASFVDLVRGVVESDFVGDALYGTFYHNGRWEVDPFGLASTAGESAKTMLKAAIVSYRTLFGDNGTLRAIAAIYGIDY